MNKSRVASSNSLTESDRLLEGHRYVISESICEEHRELFMKLSNCRRYPTLRERDIKAFYYRTKRSILSEERYFLRYINKKRRSEDIS